MRERREGILKSLTQLTGHGRFRWMKIYRPFFLLFLFDSGSILIFFQLLSLLFTLQISFEAIAASQNTCHIFFLNLWKTFKIWKFFTPEKVLRKSSNRIKFLFCICFSLRLGRKICKIRTVNFKLIISYKVRNIIVRITVWKWNRSLLVNFSYGF